MDVFLKSWIFHTEKMQSSKYVHQKKLLIEWFRVNLFSSILIKEFGVADLGSGRTMKTQEEKAEKKKVVSCQL